jgi:phosphoribosyl 1,2-cyclic phosphodiesterase
VRLADVLILEANHDLELLKADTKRPWSVKQRILARHGHLSNEAAAEVAGQIVTERLKDLFLGHLSEDCNRHELAEAAVLRKFSEMGVSHVRIHRTYPDQAAPSIDLG